MSATDFQRELELLFRSRFTLINIVSHEEERILRNLTTVCVGSKRRLYTWDQADQFRCLTNNDNDLPKAKDPIEALSAIDKLGGLAVVVLPDFQRCLDQDARTVRKLRNLAQKLKYTRLQLERYSQRRD